MAMTVDHLVRLFAKLSAAINERMRERGKFERVWYYNLACSWIDVNRELPSLFLSGNAVAKTGNLYELNVIADVETYCGELDPEFDPRAVVSLPGVTPDRCLVTAHQVVEAYDSAIEIKARHFDDLAGEIDSLTRDDEAS